MLQCVDWDCLLDSRKLSGWGWVSRVVDIDLSAELGWKELGAQHPSCDTAAELGPSHRVPSCWLSPL